MQAWSARLLVCLSLLVHPVIGQSASGHVAAVSHDSWDRLLVDSPYPAFVLFFSKERMPLPVELTDELSALARKFAGIADVLTVDCEGETHTQLCMKSETVPGLPHMRVYAAQKTRSPYTKSWYKRFEVYDGLPHARQMSIALQGQLVDDSIVRIDNMRTWDKWVDEATLPKVPHAVVAVLRRTTVVLLPASMRNDSTAGSKVQQLPFVSLVSFTGFERLRPYMTVRAGSRVLH